MTTKLLINAVKLLRIGSCLDVCLEILVKNRIHVGIQSMTSLELEGRSTKSKLFLLKYSKVGDIICFIIAVGIIGFHYICFNHSNNNIPNIAAIFQGCLLSLTNSSSTVFSFIVSGSIKWMTERRIIQVVWEIFLNCFVF